MADSFLGAVAAGNREPRRFREPDCFDPDRDDNAHLGFGGDIHYCFGAALARIEGYASLAALARRLVKPRLLADPPPFRESVELRGLLHLAVAFDRVDDWPRAVSPATPIAHFAGASTCRLSHQQY